MDTRLPLALICLLGAGPAARADIMWGANGHPITAYDGVGIGRQLDYVRDLGMKSYRVNIPDTGRAGDLAELVSRGKAREIEILPVITPGGIDLEKETARELYDKAFDLAMTLGTRFKDDIRVWELGNEMENFAIIQPCETRDDGTKYPCEWGPAGGTAALDYYGPRWEKVSAVLKGMSDGLTEADAGLRKAIGTAGWGHTGAFERMQQDGIAWDISVWHVYGQNPEWAFKEIARYGRPIWVTEFNHPYGSKNGEIEQVGGLVHMMSRLEKMAAEYQVEAAHIYELMDETYWAPDFEAYMGLVRLLPKDGGGWFAGEPKPAYLVVRDYIRGPQPLPDGKRDCDLAKIGSADSVAVRPVGYGHCLMLGRDADTAELERWTVPLQSGSTSVADFLMALLRSDEFGSRHAHFGMTDRAYVSFLYRLLLDRDADPGGLDSYSGELQRGMSRENLAAGIMESDEFSSRHPALSKAAAIEPSPAEAAAIEPSPDSKRNCDLAQIESAKSAATRAVSYGHCLMLGRDAETADFGRWTVALESGSTSVADFLITLLRSDEFGARHAQSGMTDRAYVSFLYRLLLDRDADQGGLDSYSSELQRGLTRENLAVGIMESSEFLSRHPALSEAAVIGAARSAIPGK
jgi:hypothetical protein